MSGSISYWRRRAIDVALVCMLAGGIIGTAFGVWLFTFLRAVGQLDITIGVSYVLLLGIVGSLMVAESVRAIVRARHGKPVDLRRPGSHMWIHGLPFKLRFKRSRIYVSAIPVWAIGFLIGFIGAVMGIGGGFLLVPLLIYVLRVPTATVIGTSMVLTLITMASATVMHAATNHLVDAVLALILMVGGVIGAQFGARADKRCGPSACACSWDFSCWPWACVLRLIWCCAPTASTPPAGGNGHMRSVRAAGMLGVGVLAGYGAPAAGGAAGRVAVRPPGHGHLEFHRRGARSVRRHRAGRLVGDSHRGG